VDTTLFTEDLFIHFEFQTSKTFCFQCVKCDMMMILGQLSASNMRFSYATDSWKFWFYVRI